MYWPDEAIALLESGQVTEISLDHDLGDDERGTGYDVVLWIEEAVITRGFVPPKMAVHSANSSARQKMELGIETINKRIAAMNEETVFIPIAQTAMRKTNPHSGSSFDDFLKEEEIYDEVIAGAVKRVLTEQLVDGGKNPAISSKKDKNGTPTKKK